MWTTYSPDCSSRVPLTMFEEDATHAASIILPRLMIVCAAMHWMHGVDDATKRYVLIAHETYPQARPPARPSATSPSPTPSTRVKASTSCYWRWNEAT